MQFDVELIELHISEQITNGFGAHFGDEFVAVVINHRLVFLFAQEVPSFKRGVTGVDNDVFFVINDAFELAEVQLQQSADT